jgi:hypothetical protein
VCKVEWTFAVYEDYFAVRLIHLLQQWLPANHEAPIHTRQPPDELIIMFEQIDRVVLRLDRRCPPAIDLWLRGRIGKEANRPHWRHDDVMPAALRKHAFEEVSKDRSSSRGVPENQEQLTLLREHARSPP